MILFGLEQSSQAFGRPRGLKKHRRVDPIQRRRFMLRSHFFTCSLFTSGAASARSGKKRHLNRARWLPLQPLSHEV